MLPALHQATLQLAGGLMKAPGAGVIAEALPQQQHVVLLRGGQFGQAGESRHPAPPVGQHHLQLRLLQHHLGHPDAVGIEGFAIGRRAAVMAQLPGDGVAAMLLPPSQQLAAQVRGPIL
jgi:hypothetical protein